MNDKKHYIELTYYKTKNPETEKKCEIDNTNSWIISYKNDEKYFICENKSNNKITKMKNVENFIRIWNNDIYNTPYNYYLTLEGRINIYVENQNYSGYICTKNSAISVDIIQKYIYLLKDIIEDDNMVDETVAKDNTN